MEENNVIIKQDKKDDVTVPKRDRTEEIRRLWYKFSMNKLSVAGLFIVVFVIIVTLCRKWMAPYPEHAGAFVDFSNASKAPSFAHLMGTDTLGRDVLSRVIYAFKGALTMGIGVLIVVVPFGSMLGLIAGYWRGKFVSTIIMRIADVFLALPALILVLCVSSVMEPNLTNSMLALCISWWPWYTRMVYGMVVSTRNEIYVKSAEILGASKWHIMMKEILPNCMAPIFTKMTLDIGWAILAGATLSFVGMGEQAPIPSLGEMVSNGVNYLPDQWWLSIFPALAIMVIVLGFNLVGDGIKDMLSNEGD
ncbi:ABC transporter permease [Sedimentibacter sp.]|uniref:ABC transporter permease n=1 Tax=Sedimentibacter sp. TaxID=1960295 RepID=UPI0028AC57A7|nr:ABC transporter permease [Sedimentibacter sp.]